MHGSSMRGRACLLDNQRTGAWQLDDKFLWWRLSVWWRVRLLARDCLMAWLLLRSAMLHDWISSCCTSVLEMIDVSFNRNGKRNGVSETLFLVHFIYIQASQYSPNIVQAIFSKLWKVGRELTEYTYQEMAWERRVWLSSSYLGVDQWQSINQSPRSQTRQCLSCF